jgi:hypothetical protein
MFLATGGGEGGVAENNFPKKNFISRIKGQSQETFDQISRFFAVGGWQVCKY